MGEFVLPDGSLFDHDVGLSDVYDFHCYGEFMAGTKSRLLMYGRSPKIVNEVHHISAECGDDEVDVGSTPVRAAAELCVYSDFLGVCISEEDTSINPRFGNFAEDLIIVPDGYEQTYHHAQNTSNFRDMSYLDVPKLRLAIDIRPGRMTHSSTNDGKAGMLGSRLAWLPRDSPVRCLWEVFSLFQDINLGLIRDDKFPYLPTALGGYGKPIPFGHAPNFEAIIQRYKQGAHKELCRELVRRTNRRFQDYILDGIHSEDKVLSAVSRCQSSWHDWIKGKSLYSPTCWLEAPPEVAELRVAKHGVDIAYDNVLKRLETAGYLVSEGDLAIAYEHNKLCEYLVGTETHEEFMEIRANARKEWIGLSTFSLRMYGIIEEIGFNQSYHHPLDDREYHDFWSNMTKTRLNIKTFLRQENYYRREAKDLIYKNGPMKVQVPMYPKVTQAGRRYWFEETRDTQDTTELPEHFEKLLSWALDPNRTDEVPVIGLIDDDPWIIKQIASSPGDAAFAIVTDDVKLCREAHIKTRKWVARVPTKWYYMSTYFGDGDEPWLARLQTKYPLYKWKTIQDSGSILSYEEIGFRQGVPLQQPITRPFSLTQTAFRSKGRIRAPTSSEPVEEENYSWEPYRFPESYIFMYTNALQRRPHPFRRGMA